MPGTGGGLPAPGRNPAPVHLSVAQLTVDERDQVEVVLAGGIRLLLGSGDFLERMHRFVAIYRTELAARAADVERVDLRYETGVAVAFTGSRPGWREYK